MKQWWPHYQWLKKNNINMDGLKEHQKFVQLCKETDSKQRVMDVQVSRQAKDISRQMACKKISEMRLMNAFVRDKAKQE
jgi:hypothetical protein